MWCTVGYSITFNLHTLLQWVYMTSYLVLTELYTHKNPLDQITEATFVDFFTEVIYDPKRYVITYTLN